MVQISNKALHFISKSLTEGLEHPISDATGKGVEDGVRRVDCDPVLDARQGHALLHSEEGRRP